MGVQERFRLDGKVAVVTGATKGIGFEICRVLADAGADIIAMGRDEGGLADVAREVEALGRKCHRVPVDLADAPAVKKAAARALEIAPDIDVLVNNAGIALNEPLLEATVENWDMTQAVNLRAPFLMAQAIVPQMICRGAGKIVNVSSQTSQLALQDHGAYAASKNGLNALTKVMTIEWAKHNIQCNAVLPTVILTPMGEMVWGKPEKGDPMKARIPQGRFGSTTEVADVVLFLSTTASDMVNGETVLVDGGYTAQ
ncbi:MAG: SDR family oxidoreductase [Geminicoccaceae bacterium]